MGSEWFSDGDRVYLIDFFSLRFLATQNIELNSLFHLLALLNDLLKLWSLSAIRTEVVYFSDT